MLIRYIFRLSGIALCVMLITSCSVFIGGKGTRELKADEEMVVGLPKGYTQQHFSAYTGPHPSTIVRPVEEFTFPITVGEIGPVQPLFSGDHQYPFLCRSEESHLGQPLVDNQDRVGIPVYRVDDDGVKTNSRLGYSKDCSLPTRIHYFYNQAITNKFYPLEDAQNDIAKIDINGRQQDFIVRIETGTINRFIYGIATLKGVNDVIDKPDLRHWNGVLVYQFKGGVGIGFDQGKMKIRKLLKYRREQLAKGYAVAYSTGNSTDNHYNVWLQEDTAMRVKKQFETAYGKPRYTVGIGGSGGGLQQYLLAQNRPGLLDAAIPQYSYPDMVTQTVYALDCEPLEYYFDITDRKNSYWSRWENRSKIEGLSAKTMDSPPYSMAYRVSKLVNGYWPSAPSGASECSHAWRGPAQLVLNPRFFSDTYRFKKRVYRNTHWSHWDDVRSLYGVNEQGYARSTWDNVGVQYGLLALTNGDISASSFLDLNKKVGGWRYPQQMKKARFWFVDGRTDMMDFSIWSHHNINLRWHDDTPAKRTKGDVQAIEAAYRSGMVFMGKIDIPVIDIRHYLDGELDMHHSFASLATRDRIIDFAGHADEHVIWVAHEDYDPTEKAFDVMDEWMALKQQAVEGALENEVDNSNGVVSEVKPESVVDTCFDRTGGVIASGESVWDGQWNHRAKGVCTEAYPPFKSSRQVAGEDIKGWVLKCQLQPVKDALKRGLYGSVDMQPYAVQLELLFPDGVCDYTKQGVGVPEHIFDVPLSSPPTEPTVNLDRKADPTKVFVADNSQSYQGLRQD